MRTRRQPSQQFCRHGVSLVYNYGDKNNTYQTNSENFEVEGFSQILKEQSGEKGTWVCLQTQQQ